MTVGVGTFVKSVVVVGKWHVDCGADFDPTEPTTDEGLWYSFTTVCQLIWLHALDCSVSV